MTWVLFVLISLNAVASEDSSSVPEYQVVLAQKPAKESLIPKEVLEKVKATLNPPPKEGSEAIKKKLTFMSAEVFLFEDHKGIFAKPIKVITPMGGGSINLERLLPEGKAKFRVRVAFKAPDKSDVLADRVYFVPKLEKKSSISKQDNQCGKFFDLTSFYLDELSTDKGFETYITDGIYAFNLVGTFIFLKQEESRVLIGNINFTDSRFDSYQCSMKSP